jgi:hypothetical protein
LYTGEETSTNFACSFDALKPFAFYLDCLYAAYDVRCSKQQEDMPYFLLFWMPIIAVLHAAGDGSFIIVSLSLKRVLNQSTV